MNGACPAYANWYSRVWPEILRRSKVTIAGTGDAQKILRKVYITSSLVCGRNPKRVSSEVGHKSLRMLTDQYELFIFPENWPDARATKSLVEIYGFDDAAAITVLS